MTLLWAALSIGAVYGLIAVGFNLVLSNSGVFNFAFPQFVMLGSFLGYQLLTYAGLGLGVTMLACVGVGALIGLAEEWIAIRPLGTDGGHGALVTTVGIAVILQGTAMVVWGTTPRAVNVPSASHVVTIAGGRVGVVELVLIALLLISSVTLTVVSRRTRLGLFGRVATLDDEAARLRGVNVRVVRTASLMAAGAFGCAIGPLVGALVTANVDLGNNLVVLGFVALVLGGSGSYLGATVGGLAIGVIHVMVTRYWGSEASLPVLYGLLLMVLLIKPSGLFGDPNLRAV